MGRRLGWDLRSRARVEKQEDKILERAGADANNSRGTIGRVVQGGGCRIDFSRQEAARARRTSSTSILSGTVEHVQHKWRTSCGQAASGRGRFRRNATHTGTYAQASPRRLQFAQIGRPSHLSLRPIQKRVGRASQHGSHQTRCARLHARGIGRRSDIPRQNVQAIGVRRGVRGV